MITATPLLSHLTMNYMDMSYSATPSTRGVKAVSPATGLSYRCPLTAGSCARGPARPATPADAGRTPDTHDHLSDVFSKTAPAKPPGVSAVAGSARALRPHPAGSDVHSTAETGSKSRTGRK